MKMGISEMQSAKMSNLDLIVIKKALWNTFSFFQMEAELILVHLNSTVEDTRY